MSLYTIKWLWKSSEIDIINLFNTKENRYYYCRSKIFKYIGLTLLVNWLYNYHTNKILRYEEC